MSKKKFFKNLWRKPVFARNFLIFYPIGNLKLSPERSSKITHFLLKTLFCTSYVLGENPEKPSFTRVRKPFFSPTSSAATINLWGNEKQFRTRSITKTSFSQKSHTIFLIWASKLRSRFLSRVKTDFAQIRSTRRSIDYLKSGITTPTFWENHFFQKWTLRFSPVFEGHSFWPIWLRSLVQTIYKSIFAWHKGFFNMSTFIFFPKNFR